MLYSMTREKAQTRIDAIDAILAEGVSSVNHNGRTTTYDLPGLERERSRLQRYLNRGRHGSGVRVGRYNPEYTE